MSRKTTVTVERFSWGSLRTVRVASSFSVVIHPEVWEQIDSLADGDTLSFVDETNQRWGVCLAGESLQFKARGMRVTVPIAPLA